MAKLSHPLELSSYMGLEALTQMSVAVQICTIFPRVPPKCKFTYLSHHAGQCPQISVHAGVGQRQTSARVQGQMAAH